MRNRLTNQTHIVARPLWILSLNLAVLGLARITLLLLNRSHFGELDAVEIGASLLRGLLFDVSVVATFLGLPVLMLMLPFRWSTSRSWQYIWSRISLLLTCAGIMVVVIDLTYFGLVHRHLGFEFAASQSEFGALAAMAFSEYPAQVLVMFLLPCGVAFCWSKLEFWDERVRGGRRPSRLTFPISLLLLVLGVRGGIHGKPLNIVNSFESGSLARGYLELNAPFSLYHSLRNSRSQATAYMPDHEAVEVARSLILDLDSEAPVASNYPLQRSRTGSDGRPNVVVIVLESWGSHYVDSIREVAGLPPLGATPHFDALASEGLLFTQMYCAGQLSIQGLAAVLAGIPSLPQFPWMGRGLEQSELSFLGHLAKQEGYRTHFLRGAKRSSFRLDALAALAGFDQYMGMEDIVRNTGHEAMGMWGVWDQDLFDELNRVNMNGAAPFLGFCFTVSTHEPYQVPTGFKPDLPTEGLDSDYMSSLAYSDACLGRFIEQAKQAGYFENTIFLITSDHVMRSHVSPGNEAGLFHIPALLIGPGISPGIQNKVCGQTDLLPTLCDATGWSRSYSAIGRSLLRPLPEGHGMLCQKGSLILRVEDSGYIVHNLRHTVTSKATGAAFDEEAVEQRLCALIQVTSQLLRENRFHRANLAASNGRDPEPSNDANR
ncbi:MAG: sulfatase-like hydrolase/transferase [Planctomycetota bacterium]|nr:sulfatase-like hydrolase/transferase [Planctomycetota bacterium]